MFSISSILDFDFNVSNDPSFNYCTQKNIIQNFSKKYIKSLKKVFKYNIFKVISSNFKWFEII